MSVYLKCEYGKQERTGRMRESGCIDWSCLYRGGGSVRLQTRSQSQESDYFIGKQRE